MHITLDTVVSTNPPLTAREQIVSAVRKGAYPWVAAEAAGVPRKQFRAWLHSKDPRCREFAAEIRKARAWARLTAEMALFENDPRSWLKSGPGREAKGEPGWSKEVSPLISKEAKRPVHPLADPAWRDLFGKMLDALLPFPDARAALMQLLRAPQNRTVEGQGRDPCSPDDRPSQEAVAP